MEIEEVSRTFSELNLRNHDIRKKIKELEEEVKENQAKMLQKRPLRNAFEIL
jgi:hypothetical protein